MNNNNNKNKNKTQCASDSKDLSTLNGLGEARASALCATRDERRFFAHPQDRGSLAGLWVCRLMIWIGFVYRLLSSVDLAST